MSINHVGDHWHYGEVEVVEAISGMSQGGREGAVLHISTPVIPLAEQRPSSEQMNHLMHRVWALATTRLPNVVAGQRQAWRTMVFVLQGRKEDAINEAATLLRELETDGELSTTIWRLVLSPIGSSWRDALYLAEAEEHVATAQAHQSTLVWVEGPLDRPSVTVVAP
jgi:hypothetical protein